MGPEQNEQLELFTGEQGIDCGRRCAGMSLFARIKKHEKITLSVIGIIVISVVSFSLGVEKGKGIARAKEGNGRSYDIAVLPAVGKAILPKAPEPAITAETPKDEAVTIDKNKYVIQLASYSSRNVAEKEARLLRDKGFTPLVLPKGKYTVLYAQGFANKDRAKSVLAELKKRFQDCYVRRL